jgi:poly-gamma-glutamate synthesis protein (capsule biosynthesis protein)
MILGFVLVAGACRRGSADGGGGRPGATARPPRHFTLAAAGDVLLHRPVITRAQANAGGAGYDFGPMLEGVRDVVSGADFAICHQETPISADNRNLTIANSMSFNAPSEIAGALRAAGFDACDTASNHTWDRGVKGVNDTLDVLDRAGIGHAGSSRNQQEADNPPIYDVGGVRVGHLAYTYTIVNHARPSTDVPAEAPWLRPMLWPAIGGPGILDMAQRLKARGAEFVVVSMHWGDEYRHMPNAQQRQLARDLLASPHVDLIIGDHVHVVQPCERIGDEYVMYGMGNLLSNQSPAVDRAVPAAAQDGTVGLYTVDEVAPGRFRTTMTYVPTFVVIPGNLVVKATDAHPESYRRTVANVSLLGPGACDARPAS